MGEPGNTKVAAMSEGGMTNDSVESLEGLCGDVIEGPAGTGPYCRTHSRRCESWSGCGEARLVIRMNGNVKMSRGKYAAQAVHAALLALGAHPGVPVIVLGGKPDEIAEMPTVVRDAGRTELEPGTMTAGARWETRRR